MGLLSLFKTNYLLKYFIPNFSIYLNNFKLNFICYFILLLYNDVYIYILILDSNL